MYAVVVDAVVFDVGETLVDETREYGTWADWLGVPRHTFSAVFGAVIALGMDYRDTFQYFRPGFSLDPSVRGVLMRVDRSGLARMICIRMCGHAWRHCARWAYG